MWFLIVLFFLGPRHLKWFDCLQQIPLVKLVVCIKLVPWSKDGNVNAPRLHIPPCHHRSMTVTRGTETWIPLARPTPPPIPGYHVQNLPVLKMNHPSNDSKALWQLPAVKATPNKPNPFKCGHRLCQPPYPEPANASTQNWRSPAPWNTRPLSPRTEPKKTTKKKNKKNIQEHTRTATTTTKARRRRRRIRRRIRRRRRRRRKKKEEEEEEEEQQQQQSTQGKNSRNTTTAPKTQKVAATTIKPEDTRRSNKCTHTHAHTPDKWCVISFASVLVGVLPSGKLT